VSHVRGWDDNFLRIGSIAGDGEHTISRLERLDPCSTLDDDPTQFKARTERKRGSKLKLPKNLKRIGPIHTDGLDGDPNLPWF
jgi:hypothetical protein